jgi:hypothetical protein
LSVAWSGRNRAGGNVAGEAAARLPGETAGHADAALVWSIGKHRHSLQRGPPVTHIDLTREPDRIDNQDQLSASLKLAVRLAQANARQTSAKHTTGMT